MVSIYIHIPFCKQKCYYCDFTSFSDKDNLIKEYIYSLIREIEYSKLKYGLESKEIETIYIGGGTPSYINEKYIEMLLNKIKKNFKIKQNAEITIEVNPDTIDANKVKKYREIGINRVSIGLQSCNDLILKQIGRIHNYSQFLETYSLLIEHGFDNINVDVMLGLPNQRLESLVDTLNKIIVLNPKHISCYSLILEECTKLYSLVNCPYNCDLNLNTIYNLPDDELERNMYWQTKKILESNGFIQYEVSNFAQRGYCSEHNVLCWRQNNYIGFGLNAHSYIENKRFSNIDNIEQYILNINQNQFEQNILIHENQTQIDIMKEYMLLGLRLIDGVVIKEFYNRFNLKVEEIFDKQLKFLKDNNLIEIDKNVKLTSKGLDLANVVWEEFV